LSKDPASAARLVWARRAAVVWGVFLLALTSWPSPPTVPVLSSIPSFDKYVHATLYGVEGFLLLFAIRWPGRPGFTLLRALAVTGSLAAFGTADETHQAFIPGRSMDAMDCAMDTAGAASGALVAGVWGRRKRKTAG
jgi:VanZ family protein